MAFDSRSFVRSSLSVLCAGSLHYDPVNEPVGMQIRTLGEREEFLKGSQQQWQGDGGQVWLLWRWKELRGEKIRHVLDNVKPD